MSSCWAVKPSAVPLESAVWMALPNAASALVVSGMPFWALWRPLQSSSA